jgi:hypothetical protein
MPYNTKGTQKYAGVINAAETAKNHAAIYAARP